MGKGKLIGYALILLILLVGLIDAISYGGSVFFGLELLGILFILLLILISAFDVSGWGKNVLFFTFLVYFFNLVLLWFYQGNFYLTLFVVCLIGLALSLPKKSEPVESFSEPSSKEPPHSVVFDSVESSEETATEAKVVAKPVNKAKTQFSPGKLVASKTSNVYHLPKCDWAKRIQKGRRVWYTSREEAWEKGLRAHSCVEK